MAKNFICFKFDQQPADRFETAAQAACVTQRKQKRQDLAVETDSSSDSDTDSLLERPALLTWTIQHVQKLQGLSPSSFNPQHVEEEQNG